MMAEKAPVENLIAIAPSPDVGADVYTNEHLPWTPGEGTRGIFGGFVIAHCVRAAQATSPPDFDVHSLQSVFLKPGRREPRILYRVDRIADGRTFATRVVRAEQGGRSIFIATIGLQKRGGTTTSTTTELRHAVPPPPLDLGGGGGGPNTPAPQPEDIPESSKHDLLREVGYERKPWAKEDVVASKSAASAPATAALDPFDWRHLPWTASAITRPPHEFRLHSYVRSPRLSEGAGRDVHLAALAFLTDEWLIATVNLSSPGKVGRWSSNVALQASVNHSVLFHDAGVSSSSPPSGQNGSDVRADEWMICERKATWAAGGRVLVEQRLWSKETGRLLVSCWQEGLVRLKGAANL